MNGISYSPGLLRARNLSDLTNKITARNNLQLGALDQAYFASQMLEMGGPITPAICFSPYYSTGIYAPAANQVGITCGGSLVAFVTASGFFMQSNGRFYSGDGSAAFPAFTYPSDTDTGMYRSGANELSFATGGVQRLSLGSTGDIVKMGAGQFLGNNGTAALPCWGFSSDFDCGLYRIGSDNIGLSAGGTKVLDLASVVGTPRMGFFGAAHAPKPSITGSRGGNAALASLLTELATLGLITDTTTP